MPNVEFKNLIDFKKMGDEVVQRKSVAFGQAVQIETGEIVRRTQSGIDVNGSPFKAYSKEYAAYKKKKGRNATPDLTFSGKMLGSIKATVKATATKFFAEIKFSSATEAAKAKGNLKKRKFFGLSDEQIQRIRDAITNTK